MNWDAFGAVGEIVGALAVVVTLAYLAVQLKLARNAYEIQSTYSSQAGYSRWRTAVMENPELREAIAKSNRGERLSDEEDLAVSTLTQELFICVAVSIATNQREDILADSTGQIAYLVRVFSDNPGLIAYWHSHKALVASLLPDFTLAVDEKLQISPIPPGERPDAKRTNPPNKFIEDDA